MPDLFANVWAHFIRQNRTPLGEEGHVMFNAQAFGSIQDAEDAAYAAHGAVYFPGATYNVSSTINRHLGVPWIGEGSCSTMGQLVRLLWTGAAGGTMVSTTTASTDHNISGTWTQGICFHGNNSAAYGYRFLKGGGTPGDGTYEGKLDSWTWFDNCAWNGATTYGLSVETDGCTNFSITRSRWDYCGSYGMYVKNYGGVFMTVDDITFDSSTSAADGLFYFDSTAAADNSKCYLGLYNMHPEVNGAFNETYTDGTGAERRGLIRFGVKPGAVGGVQFDVDAAHIWVAIAPAAESFAIFQIMGGTATQNEQAMRLSVRHLHGINRWSSNTKESHLVGGVSAGYCWPYEGAAGTKQVTDFHMNRQDTTATEAAKSVTVGHIQVDNLEIGAGTGMPAIKAYNGAASGTATKGTLGIDYANGVLYINTDGGSTWVKVGTQS